MRIISTIAGGGPGEILLQFSFAEKTIGTVLLAMALIIMILLIFYLKKKLFEKCIQQ